MNNAINNHSIFAYDDTLIEKIRQILQQGLEKLKAFVKTRKESKFTVYDELDEKFNEIAQKLEKCEILNDEFNYFLAISDKILYIVKKNCEDPSFDHCEFALELFDFFKELWNQKIELLNDFSGVVQRRNDRISECWSAFLCVSVQPRKPEQHCFVCVNANIIANMR